MVGRFQTQVCLSLELSSRFLIVTSQSQRMPRGLRHALLPSKDVPFCVMSSVISMLFGSINLAIDLSKLSNVVLGLTIENF